MGTMPRISHALTSCALSLLLAACAGDDGGTSGGGTSGGSSASAGTSAGSTGGGSAGSGSTGGVPEYSHAQDIQPIWTATCVNNCHDSACAAPGACDSLTQNLNLALDGDAYDRIVNGQSVQNAAMVWVKPGDPEASYLWHKVAGTHEDVCSGDCGVQMPKGTDPLDMATQQMIFDWIQGGAKP